MTQKTIPLSEISKGWFKDPEFVKEYDALEDEFTLIDAVLRARVKSGLTQAEIAQRMGTTQSAVARLESGRKWPSMRTLQKYAEATGTKLKIAFE